VVPATRAIIAAVRKRWNMGAILVQGAAWVKAYYGVWWLYSRAAASPQG